MADLSDDAAHMDDDCDNKTDDNSDDSNGDNSDGGDDKKGVSLKYPEVRFSENYAIEETRPEVSIPYQGDLLHMGALFKSKQELILAFRQYCVDVKMNYRVKHSCTIRFETGCKDVNCKIMLCARCRPGCSFWHVKFMPSHTCTPDVYDSHFRSLKAIVIGSLFSERVASSEYTPRMLMGELLEQHGMQIMYTKAWISLQHAKRLTYGNADESYQQLPSYFQMLKETNPGSIMVIEINENNDFLYSFFAFGACLYGFRSYIRSIVVIDATHLKDEHKWVIFVSTCKDGEEMIYPIAFGFGDNESDRSRIWFLTKFREAIGVREDLVIVFDRHQNIANAMSHVFPFVPHVFCFFHLKQKLEEML
ncbi:protein FAR1-RELATED SEQUENCE 5-like [Diospyros lotus]|uniref:protein FAR1-RELATED SEQUENCE 5-like n=1 Tax=Diospyros lotus TaxID=55363 RepID=UPI00225C35C9|nr:protein FAR1-RELATED SEQUENCE 5-like [Diospyros lotus]